MAASVMHNLASFSTITQGGLSSDPRTVKHKHRNDESRYQESPSTFSQISSETCNSVIESRSLNNDYESCSSLSELKSGKWDRNSKISDRDSDRTKCGSTGMPVARRSQVNPYITGTESTASDHDFGSRDKSSLISRDKIADLQANRITSGSGELVPDKGVSSDCSKFSCDHSKTSFQPEKDNKLYDRNNQVSLAKFESLLENYGFPEMKQSYNSKLTGNSERKGVNENQSRTTICSTHQWKNGVNSNVSEMKRKLRDSMESEFLSKELREHDSIKLETSIGHAKDTLRSVDEILRDYGISNDVPSSQYKSTAYKNLSQNNETSQVSESSDPGTNESTMAMRSREELSQSMMVSSTTVILPASKESRINSSIYLDNKNTATHAAAYKSNVSQNNEAKYALTHQELLRKYGSSVDYTSIAAGGKYSTSKHYGRYDYGKTTFSGDTASAAQPGYTNKTSVQDFEVKKSNLLSRRLEGSQVDIVKPGSIAAIKEEEYNSIRQTGSSIDAVEFTITSERQRLRKLNNMITSTSVTTSDGTSHKNLMTRYLSPQREYNTLRASNALGKVYSSPTFPSSYYGASLTPKGSWADSVGQRESPMYLGKSASAPNSWSNGFQSFTNYSTSFETRSPYLSHYSSRALDRQYNNSTPMSLSLERLVSQINSSHNHTRALQTLQQEIPLRRKNKQSVLIPTQHKNYNQWLCPLQNTSSISMFSIKSDASCTTTTSECKKGVCKKKIPNRNTNDSKSTSGVYGSFSNQKSLNKPWQGSRMTKTTVEKSGQKQNMSNCLPYSSNSLSQVRKVETFHNLAKELFKNDCNQSSTNSKQKRTASGKVNNKNSVGGPNQLYGYGRESNIVPSRKSQGQCSVHASRTSQQTNTRILRSVEKKKARIASEILIQKTMEIPRSTRMHHNNVPVNMVAAYRPHFNVAAPSRSYPHFSTRLPYQVYRDYSTINFYTSRPSYY